MGKIERKDGYYWVRYGDSWQIVELLDGKLYCFGDDNCYTIDTWDEIGPRIPEYKPKRKGKA